MPSLLDNFKTAKLIFCFRPKHDFFPDKPAHLRILNRALKLLQLRLSPFRHQFDSPVIQIPYRPGYFKPRRHRFRGVSKTNALNAPGIKNLHALPVHSQLSHREIKPQPQSRTQRYCSAFASNSIWTGFCERYISRNSNRKKLMDKKLQVVLKLVFLYPTETNLILPAAFLPAGRPGRWRGSRSRI